MADIIIHIEGAPEEVEKLKDGGDPLKDFCLEEADKFDSWLRENAPGFEEGLALFEKHAIRGYLYQRIRGHYSG